MFIIRSYKAEKKVQTSFLTATGIEIRKKTVEDREVEHHGDRILIKVYEKSKVVAVFPAALTILYFYP